MVIHVVTTEEIHQVQEAIGALAVEEIHVTQLNLRTFKNNVWVIEVTNGACVEDQTQYHHQC